MAQAKQKISVSKASYKELYSIFVLSREYFPYANFTYSEIERRVESGKVIYLVARVGGKLAGYLDFELHKDHAKILGLAVLDEFRGKGVGKKLVGRALAEIRKRGFKRVYLFVSRANAVAQKMYAEHGFVSAGLLEKKINGEDVLLFQKDFSK